MATKDYGYTDVPWRPVETVTYIPLREALSCPQGWQCPACKVVYSPSVERCTCQASEKMRLGL